MTTQVRDTLTINPHLHAEELKDAWRETLHTQRSTLTDLFRENIIAEDVYNKLITEIDAEINDPDSPWPELEQTEPSNDANETRNVPSD